MELICVIAVLGVLAATAVPRFIALGTDARLASLKTLKAALTTTALDLHVTCKTNPACDYDSGSQGLVVGGVSVPYSYGWPDAGEFGRIDSFVISSGFTVSVAWPVTTWTLDGAPSPGNCAVRYQNALVFGPDTPLSSLISTDTSGC